MVRFGGVGVPPRPPNPANPNPNGGSNNGGDPATMALLSLLASAQQSQQQGAHKVHAKFFWLVTKSLKAVNLKIVFPNTFLNSFFLSRL